MLGLRLSHSSRINLWISRLPATDREPGTYPWTCGREEEAGGIPVSRPHSPCAKVTSRRQRGTLCKSSRQNITNQPTLRVGHKAPHKCVSPASAPPESYLFSHNYHCVVCAHATGVFSVSQACPMNSSHSYFHKCCSSAKRAFSPLPHLWKFYPCSRCRLGSPQVSSSAWAA